MKFPGPVMHIMNTLNQAGYQCYGVGGCVRDKLLGRSPKDYDLATDALPEVVEQLFARTIPTGKKHGTITVLQDGMTCEVTTFRRETGYSDHRHPDEIAFVRDLKEDLARRDFTINAMAWSPRTGVVDPFGGQADLLKKTIRCVGDPDRRFREDALRMVRAHRFAARFGFEIEEKTEEAIVRNEGLIAQVAVERLVPEWMEILQQDPRRIRRMTGLFRPWIPELEVCARTPQNSPYHYTDVLGHILDSIRFLQPFDGKLALTLLLHDLGKPAARTTVDGRDHFYRHPRLGMEIARRVVEDLKLPAAWKREIPELVLHHDDIMGPGLKNIYKFRIQYGWSDALLQDLFRVQRCDILAHSGLGRKRLERWQESVDFYAHARQDRPFKVGDLAINGRDVMRYAGLQGKDVGKALNDCLELCFFHPEHNERLALLTFILRKGKMNR